MATAPLSVSDSIIKLYNAALAEIGVPKIGNLLENSLAARTGNTTLSDTLEAAMSSYPWRFARSQVRLTNVTGTAPAPWESMWALPTEALVTHSVWQGRQKVVFDIFERNVVIMAAADTPDDIEAEVTIYKGPDSWPGYFRRAMILQIAADVAMALTQDQKTADRLEAKASRAMMFARSRDAQGRTPSRIDTKGFIRARRSRGGF